MKKTSLLFASIIMLFIISINTADAQVFKGRSLSEISTKNPQDTIEVKSLKKLNLGNGTIIEKNSIIKGKMTDVVSPEKFHKNASFTFIPTEYTDSNGIKHLISKEIKATYRQKLKPDFEHSEIGVGMTTDGSDPSNSMYVFSPSYISNTKKIVRGEGKEVWDEYKNRTTPWGKGEHINIKQNEIIYFNFPDVE